jgi:tripartite-type tricarboxylate transporter receptor subunit TctC
LLTFKFPASCGRRLGLLSKAKMHANMHVDREAMGMRNKDFNRRSAIAVSLAGLLGATSGVFAQAKSWRPSKLVRMIVPQAAGGYSDVMARLITPYLQDHLGQTVIVENKVGGAGTLGCLEVAHAEPDGQTMLMGNSATQAVAYSLIRNISYTPEDLLPVSCLIKGPNVLIANKDLPVNDFTEFVELLRKNPGKYNFCTPGFGTTPHLAGVWFNALMGTQSTAVHYHGSPAAMVDLYSGVVQFSFDALSNVAQPIRAGRIKAFGVTGENKVKDFPDLPPLHTMAPELKDFITESWVGLFAPKGTPDDIVNAYNEQVRAFLTQPDIDERFAKLGGIPAYSSAADFKAYDDKEIAKWAAVTKAADLHIDVQ